MYVEVFICVCVNLPIRGQDEIRNQRFKKRAESKENAVDHKQKGAMLLWTKLSPKIECLCMHFVCPKHFLRQFETHTTYGLETGASVL